MIAIISRIIIEWIRGKNICTSTTISLAKFHTPLFIYLILDRVSLCRLLSAGIAVMLMSLYPGDKKWDLRAEKDFRDSLNLLLLYKRGNKQESWWYGLLRATVRDWHNGACIQISFPFHEAPEGQAQEPASGLPDSIFYPGALPKSYINRTLHILSLSFFYTQKIISCKYCCFNQHIFYLYFYKCKFDFKKENF
jgi:hypothetical protein